MMSWSSVHEAPQIAHSNISAPRESRASRSLNSYDCVCPFGHHKTIVLTSDGASAIGDALGAMRT